ncbi:CTD phosphatase Fcp1 [Massospora cicadina]|nr:CTD phosphatase Fcp1 [Massospora cicadina]
MRANDVDMEPFNVQIKPEHLPATIVEIFCEPGSEIDTNERILKYEYLRPFRELRKDDVLVASAVVSYKKSYDYLYSKLDGVIDTIHGQVGDCIESVAQPVVTLLVPCNHSRTVLNDYCADCGAYWPCHEFVAFSHNEAGIRISRQEADRIARETKGRLIDSRKLIMILDLDQTIIQATVDPQIGLWMKDENDPNYPATKDICTFKLPDKEYTYYVKPRAGLVKFLETVHELYELHVYTMGTRPYAEAVAQAIDPTGKYFAGRILSRDENGSQFKKDVKRLFPADSSMVVVLDDRPDVWGWSPNMIKVWPYEFFGVGDINSDSPKDKSANLPNSSEMNNSENEAERPKLMDNDGELGRLLGVLVELHRRFYRQYDNYLDDLTRFMSTNDIPFPSQPDATAVLTKLKTDVLSGVKLFFAGVFPSRVDPRSTELWIWAETFGARCFMKSGREITHVVAIDARNADVRAALGLPGVRILTLKWLYDSLVYWHRQDEKEYLLQGLPAPPRLRIEDLAESAFTPTPPCNGDAALECLEPGLSDLRDESVLDEDEDPTGAEDLSDEDMEDLDQSDFADLFTGNSNWERNKGEVDAELAEMGITLSDVGDSDAESGMEVSDDDKRPRSPSDLSVTPSKRLASVSFNEVPEEYLQDLEALSNHHSDQDCQEICSDDWEEAIDECNKELESAQNTAQLKLRFLLTLLQLNFGFRY